MQFNSRGHLRVVYIIGQLRRGGAEQQLYYLLKCFPHSATIIALEKNSNESYWVHPIRDLGYKVVELQRHGHFDARRLTDLVHQIRVLQPNIVHLFTDNESGLYGRIASLIMRQSCIIVNERSDPSRTSEWLRYLKRWWLNRYVTAFIVNTRSSHDYMIEYLKSPAEKVHYIPNGLDFSVFKYNSDSDKRAKLPNGWQKNVVIGSVGSLRSVKAPEVLVRVAQRVIQLRPKARFIHIGDGPLKPAVESLRNDLGLSEHLLFLGERFDIPQLLQSIDIFVMTSRSEGMPNAIMEAMAMRLPCVVTDAGDSRELVRDGKTGFITPVDDELTLAERIVYLIDSVALRQEMGMRGYEVIQAYSAHNMAEQYAALYRQLLK